MKLLLKLFPIVAAATILVCLPSPGFAQDSSDLSSGRPVIAGQDLLAVPVGGLSATNSSDKVVAVAGPSFTQALHVTVGSTSPETNATQLTIPISSPVSKGDCLLSTFYLRGASQSGNKPAHVEFLFERSTNPWTKSTVQDAISLHDPNAWKKVVVPFVSAEDYKPGEAMCSLRLAFGPQTVEIGGLSVVDYANTTTIKALTLLAASQTPLGNVNVHVDTTVRRQALVGLGGDFCQPRYGDTRAIDPVGSYTLSHLDVAQARVGIPLNDWAPSAGVYSDTAQAHAAFLLLQILHQHKIPLIGTVWEGPQWMLPGGVEKSGRVLDPSQYAACIDAIAQFLVTARDKYGVPVDYYSFNEPNYGVNFLFTPQTMDAFIRQAGPRFKALGLKTKFLVGDTTGGLPVVDYATPLLQDPQIAQYLGPISFHCWDALGAPEADYAAIATLGKTYHKPIICAEGGYDAGLWQQPDMWNSWENGLKTALAYAKTFRLTGASALDYWTYENNYPLVSEDSKTEYPIFKVMKQMQNVFPHAGSIVATHYDSDDLQAVTSTGPKPHDFAVLLVNPIGAGTVSVTGLPKNAPVKVTTQTESTSGNSTTQSEKVTGAGVLIVDMQLRSIVTISSAR